MSLLLFNTVYTYIFLCIQTVQNCARGLSLQPPPPVASVAEFTCLSQQARKMFLQTEGRALTSEEEREDKVYFMSVAPASDSFSEGKAADASKDTVLVIDKLAPPTLIPPPSSSTGPATTDNNISDDTVEALPTLSPTIYTSTRSFTAQPLDSLEELNNHIILSAGVTMRTIPTHSGALERVRIMTDSASLSTDGNDENKLPEEKTQEYTRVAITVTDDDDDDSSGEGSNEEEEKEGRNSDLLPHVPQLPVPKQPAVGDDDMSVNSTSDGSDCSNSGSQEGGGLDFAGESSFTRLNITENNNDDDDSGDDSSGSGSVEGGDGGGADHSEGEDDDEEEDDFIVIPIRHSHDTPTTATTTTAAASPDTTVPLTNAATNIPPIIPLTSAPICPIPAPAPSADVTLPPIPPSTADIAEQQALLYKDQGNECIRNKHYTEAIGNYTMSIKFDPTLASAYNNRASVYITLKVWLGLCIYLLVYILALHCNTLISIYIYSL